MSAAVGGFGIGPGRPGAAAVVRHGAALGCLVAGTLAALLASSPVPALLAGVAAPLLERALRRRSAERVAERTEDEVERVCAALAAELRTGCLPAEALERAVRDEAAGAAGGLPAAPRPGGVDWAAVLGAARFGGDTAAELRQASRGRGAAGLAGLAACWQVAADSGAGLTAGVERMAAALRRARAVREDVRAQLAGPRATAAMLAALPVLGLLLGGAMGAHPLRVLLHSGAGIACLTGGLLLEAAGLWWTGALVRGAGGRVAVGRVAGGGPGVPGRRARWRRRRRGRPAGGAVGQSGGVGSAALAG